MGKDWLKGCDRGEENVNPYGIITGAKKGAIACDRNAGNRDIFFWHQLMGAFVLAEVPNSNISTAVTRNQLPLVRVDDDIIDRNFVIIIALYASCPCIPDLDSAILGASNHPFALAMEGYACDVAGVAFKGENGTWIG